MPTDKPQINDGSDSTNSSTNELRLDGDDDLDHGIGYEFTVTSTLEQISGKGATINPDDTVSGRTAFGNVWGGIDAFRFTGEIDAFEIDDPARVTVTLNGVEVDPATLGDKGSEPEPEPEPEPDEEGGSEKPVSGRRLYCYGPEWVAEDERGAFATPISYTVVLTPGSRVEKADKADEFDAVVGTETGHQYAIGSVPANGDDAFTLYGEVAWVNDGHELSWQLAGEDWEPPRKTPDPRQETGSDDSGGGSDSGSGGGGSGGEGGGSGGSGYDGPPRVPVDGADGPDPGLLDKYDHYLEVTDQAADNINVRYHLVTTGEIVAAGTGDQVDNRGYGGHADGIASGGHDGYYFNGALLAIYASPSLGEFRIFEKDGALEWQDIPFGFFVDGTRVNHVAYDALNPAVGTSADIPMGYSPQGLREELQPTAADAEWVFETWRGFADLNNSDLKPGHTVFFDGRGTSGDDDIDFPQIDKKGLREFSTDAVTFSCAPGTRLATQEEAPDRWANTGLVLSGKHSAFVSMSYHGGEKDPQSYSGVASVGLELAGEYPLALNNRVSYFGQVGLQCTGIGETVYSTNAHNCHTKGSGYGISSSGPVGQKDWDEGAVWTPEELNTVRPWHERTQIKYFDISDCRHHIERGTNAAVESGYGLLRPANNWQGSHDDAHRPSRGEDYRHDYVIRFDPQNPGHGAWARGRPRIFRMDNLWFDGWPTEEWGDEVSIDERYPGRGAPFVQVCAESSAYNRRKTFPRTSGPFLSGLGENPDENDPLVWQIGQTQIGGDKPDWLTHEVSKLVDRRS